MAVAVASELRLVQQYAHIINLDEGGLVAEIENEESGVVASTRILNAMYWSQRLHPGDINL